MMNHRNARSSASNGGKWDGRVVRYAEWVIRWRWAVLAFSLIAAMVLASGASRLNFIDEYRVFFGEDNPQLVAFDAVQEIYTKNDNILFVVTPPDGDGFSPQALAAVEDLTAEAWKIPFAMRVESVTNFQHSYAEGDDLTVEDLISGARDLSAEETELAKQVALAEPFLRSRLVPADTHVNGVNVTLQFPREEMDETARTVAYARDLVTRIETDYPGTAVAMTGMAMLNNAFQESAMRDMGTLVPLMYVGIIVVMVILLRSLSATLSAVFVIALSLASAMGLAGWLGFSLTPPSSAAPTMILTLAVADSIHILISMLREMRRGLTKRQAIVESVRINAQPIFLTSLTTCIGFLSMNFSEVPPLNDLGNITTMGVAAAWLYSMLFLPAAVAVLPIRARGEMAVSSAWMDRMADFVIGSRKPLLWASAVLSVVVASFLPLNDLNDQFVDYFHESTTFRQDADYAMENLSGIYQIEFSLDSGEEGGISEPGYLRKIDEFATWYRGRPGVMHVATISDVMKRLNKNLHGDDPAAYGLPEERNLAAQYLLLYEMSLPYGLDLNNQINVDKSASRFMVTVENVTSKELVQLVETGEGWLRDNAPQSMHTHGVGPGVMFSYISARNIRSMLIGTVLAFILISVTLVFALRSMKFGWLSLLPNVMPAVFAFGLWGVFVGQVNLGLSVVTGMSLGIVVDDTVHFLSKYLRARREKGLSSEQAVRFAFSTVGLALVATSVILVAGFAVLAQSTFEFNAGMGKMTALTIAIALLADLLFLPPLLMKVDGSRKIPGYTQKEVLKDDDAYAAAS
jgi:hypothetical protein